MMIENYVKWSIGPTDDSVVCDTIFLMKGLWRTVLSKHNSNSDIEALQKIEEKLDLILENFDKTDSYEIKISLLNEIDDFIMKVSRNNGKKNEYSISIDVHRTVYTQLAAATINGR